MLRVLSIRVKIFSLVRAVLMRITVYVCNHCQYGAGVTPLLVHPRFAHGDERAQCEGAGVYSEDSGAFVGAVIPIASFTLVSNCLSIAGSSSFRATSSRALF